MSQLNLKCVPIFLLTIISFTFGSAQSPTHQCGTDFLHQKLLQESPQARQDLENAELTYREYLRNLPQNPAPRTVKRIPVVVHIIQSSNQILLSDAEVQAQIDVLNEDFRKMPNTNGDGNGVDTEFEFCLASIDPNGCPTTGINRLVNPTASHSSILSPLDLKGLIQWDPNKYLNIWVPKTIESGFPPLILAGYATFPADFPTSPNLDGIVVASPFFGPNSDSLMVGRITTHEVGHWVGLYHTFQEGCLGNTDTTCTTNGDRVCDTPQASIPNNGCPTNVNSCVDFPIDNPDLVENYMDYSNGICFNMFTQGQKDRMDIQMQTFRSNLWSASNLAATGCDGTVSPGCIPLAAFTSDFQYGCVGQPISFSDMSLYQPTSWNWTFQGGVPATSTAENPTVTYSTPGVYSVSLIATNSLGGDSITQTSYMVISAADPNGTAESFEGDTLLPLGWYSQATNQNKDWKLTTTAASEGAHSMVMDNFEYTQIGATADLNSTVYDFSNWATTELHFDYAYKRYNAFNIDTLEVRISTDCGASWQSAWLVGGIPLSTVPGNAINSGWTPTDSTHWKTIVVNLDSYVQNQSQVRIQFRSICGNGQNIYLDNIRFSSTSTAIDHPNDLLPILTVAPNPFHEKVRIAYRLEASGRVHIQLTDVNGKVLVNESKGWQDPGNYELDDVGHFSALPGGIYFLQLSTDQGKATTKLVK